jgi:hypothetical protein
MNDLHAPRLVDLVQDAATALPPCVSLYVPTARAGAATRQGATHLKNLLRDARRDAAAAGFEHTVDAVLAPADRLVDDGEFWQHQAEGLALLLATGLERTLRLPLAVEPAAFVADALHLRPLLPLDDDLEFTVLALSQNRVRLLRGNRWQLDEPEHTELPRSLAEALWPDDPEKSLQAHGGPGRSGDGTVFHGHGTAGNGEIHKEELARYFRAIDAALLAAPGDYAARPLLLACVDYCAAIYRGVSRHPQLAAEQIPGNPDHTSDEALHATAWRLLTPRLEPRHAAAIARYREGAGTGRTSDQIELVLAAAREGRVRDLFTTAGRHRWGRLAVDGVASLEVHGERQPGDVDLIDRAAAFTIATRGAVHVVDDAALELRDGVAATFRF